jgi:hypothetical protein
MTVTDFGGSERLHPEPAAIRQNWRTTVAALLGGFRLCADKERARNHATSRLCHGRRSHRQPSADAVRDARDLCLSPLAVGLELKLALCAARKRMRRRPAVASIR